MSKLLACPLTIRGVEELDGFARVGVSHVLSILDPYQPEPPIFGRYRPHRRTTMRFHDVVTAVDGHQQPSETDVERILEFGRDVASSEPLHLLVHCYAGVSRSTAASLIRPATLTGTETARRIARASGARHPWAISMGCTIHGADS